MSERKSGISYTSAVIISNENNRPIGIPRYDFSEELSKVFNASFAENESLKEKWNNERLVKYNSKDNEKSENVEKRGGDTEYISIVRTDESFIEIGGSEDILIEATEFVILDYLSKHLDSYFNDVEERDKEVVKIERKDIPKILIENRVLSTLSKPLDERDVFCWFVNIRECSRRSRDSKCLRFRRHSV